MPSLTKGQVLAQRMEGWMRGVPPIHQLLPAPFSAHDDALARVSHTCPHCKTPTDPDDLRGRVILVSGSVIELEMMAKCVPCKLIKWAPYRATYLPEKKNFNFAPIDDERLNPCVVVKCSPKWKKLFNL